MAENTLEKLKKEATKLGIPFDEEKVTEEELSGLVEEKKEAEKEENRIKTAEEKKAKDEAKKSVIVLKNVFGEDMDPKDYFWPSTPKKEGEKVTFAPSWFNRTCGFPVDREDMIAVFNRIFDPKKNFLFYKVRDKELYIIIVPIKYSSIIGAHNESIAGDFQKHAISFIGDGSVNVDTLKLRLQKIARTINQESK